MSFADLMREHRRLAILRTLGQAGDYTANANILQQALAEMGMAASHDVLSADLAWLEEQGLAAIEVVGGFLRVATLTQRGLDVAEGRATVPGIPRPLPEV